MKKKQPEQVEYHDLKIGDFVESNDAYLFCYSVGGPLGGPSCLGHGKPKTNDPNINYNAWIAFGGYTKFTPSKSFINLCKRLLKSNLKQGHVDNLSYVEALAALKKYD